MNFETRNNSKEEKMGIIGDPTSEQTEEKVTTVIAEDVHIKGSLGFETSLMIKEPFEGEII